MMDLTRFPRRRYTHGPTPIEFLPHFTEALGGPQVWSKRDDELGQTPGGTKTRKLEYLVAVALQLGCDSLITCGAPRSNHCRLTLCAAIKEGLKCRFVIEERVPGTFRDDASGNQFLFRLLGVEHITVVPAGTDLLAAMRGVQDELAANGRKGYAIPTGGSNALGGLGYVACAHEIQQQLFELDLHIDRVVLGSGSSGTHGGLLAGFLGNHVDIPITGIGVSRDPEAQAPIVRKEVLAVCELLGVDVDVPAASVHCVGGYWQPKYSVPNGRMVEAVQLLARTEAILLDPVYTGKAMAGLIGMSRSGEIARDETVLFLHTGGTPSVFAYADVLLGARVVDA
jgi:D-cysteine desulfhydrase